MKALLFALLLSVLISFLGYYPGWFDSAELATASELLGIAHPPGHSVYILTSKLFTFLPFGSAAFRLAFFSALCACLAACLLGSIARYELSKSAALGFIVMLFVFLHPSIALHSTRVEVYTLQLLLSVAVTFSILWSVSKEDHRYMLLAGFLGGLAAAAQPLLGATLIPGLVLGVFYQRRNITRIAGISFVLYLVGLLPTLYLPIRSSVNPILNWDAPSTLGQLMVSLTARDYQTFLTPDRGELFLLSWLHSEVWVVVSIPLFLLSVLGLFSMWHKGNRRRAELLGVLFVSAWSMWLLREWAGDLHLRNPDIHGYLLQAIAITFLCAISGAYSLITRIEMPQFMSIATVMLLIGVSSLRSTLHTYPSWSAHSAEGADILGRHLDHAPAAAALEVGSDHWIFPFWYRSYVEGRRPDVALMATGLLPAKWYRDQLLERYGEVRKRIPWSEERTEHRTYLSGFLYAEEPVYFPVQDELSKFCRDRAGNDPFRTQRSVCAQIASRSFNQFLTFGETTRFVHKAEQFLNAVPSTRICNNPRNVEMPFPLAYRGQSWFLVQPDELLVGVMLVHAGCGRERRAMTLFRKFGTSQDLDATLLYAALTKASGDTKEAKAAIAKLRARNPYERYVLHQAKAHF